MTSLITVAEPVAATIVAQDNATYPTHELLSSGAVTRGAPSGLNSSQDFNYVRLDPVQD